MRPLALLLPLALVAGPTADALAQCCGTPTVAYSPVIAAPAPVVAQTTTYDGWYPGKYLGNFSRSLFGWGGTTTTYTAGYAPYTAGYSPYTAGYAPYSVGYAPATTYSVGYAPSAYNYGYQQTAYRPTYPASYGVVQTVSRPVSLSPVYSQPACSSCGGCGACDACGVSQASYDAPSTGCSSCAGGSTYTAPLDDYNYNYNAEPRPALGPNENPEPERSIRSQRPEVEDSFNDFEDRTQGDPAAANDYFRAPPLFTPPSNRVTRDTHPAPVQMAVYRRSAESRPASFRPADDRPAASKTHHLSASGWGSAAD